MEHPIDYYRIQNTSHVDEAMPVGFSELIDTYETIRQGRITDTGTIRDIARQFAAIAGTFDVSKWFPYDASQIAAALNSRASALEMKASAETSGQVDRQDTKAEPDPQKFTDEISVDLMKIREELLYKFTAQEKDQKVPLDIDSISDQWAGLLKFAEIAEQEEQKLAAKGTVQGPIDHDDLWKEWEI
jgi:hypothetical protein